VFLSGSRRVKSEATLVEIQLNHIKKNKEYSMLEGIFQPMHLVLIFGIALLVFGPKKLPELGKGLGDGIRGFKSAMNPGRAKEEEDTSALAEKSGDV
jgi:sec-independent protein translocase protein TatA